MVDDTNDEPTVIGEQVTPHEAVPSVPRAMAGESHHAQVTTAAELDDDDVTARPVAQAGQGGAATSRDVVRAGLVRRDGGPRRLAVALKRVDVSATSRDASGSLRGLPAGSVGRLGGVRELAPADGPGGLLFRGSAGGSGRPGVTTVTGVTRDLY